MNSKYMVVVATVATMLLGATALATEDVLAGKKKHYEKNQAISQVNECGNSIIPTNVGCRNTASWVQRDENVVSQASEQAFPSVE